METSPSPCFPGFLLTSTPCNILCDELSGIMHHADSINSFLAECWCGFFFFLRNLFDFFDCVIISAKLYVLAFDLLLHTDSE